MNMYLIIVLGIIIVEYLLNIIVNTLNIRHLSVVLPDEFKGWYDDAKYKKAQEYLKVRTRFSFIVSTFFSLVVVSFILSGGFNFVDKFARGFGFGPILTGLIFGVVLMFSWNILHIPFSIYSIFVIEEKFGFNRTTPKTFITDRIKGWVLGAIIGGIMFSVIIWFFLITGKVAWLYCWSAVVVFELFLMFISPVVIMPLFNKFIPLEDGELKKSIEDYARREKFQLKGVFKMDGSKRSSKSNAFFTGFGKFRRIVLFDTLIAKHTVGELVSVLAHEMGHYKKKHILRMIISSILTSGAMFYFLSLFINNPGLFSAFGVENLSIYASLFFFGFLYAPINMFFSIIEGILSRKYEYEADIYAVKTYNQPQDMISALKKLSVDNLSNLTPHPLKVFFDYSHPPVLERIKAIRKISD